MPSELSIGQCATLACLFEVLAAKPGNVHRGADFEDVGLVQFAASAAAIAEAMNHAAAGQRVGASILEAVTATRTLVGTNTNLGIILLLAPLASVPRSEPLRAGVVKVLRELNDVDAGDVYSAIKLAQPGGLGEVPEADVHSAPPKSLLAAMGLAAERDLIARQYVHDFADVFDRVVVELTAGISARWPIQQTIIVAHLKLLAACPDSLIARKCGPETATASAVRAQKVLATGAPGSDRFWDAVADFDFWLRSDGHRRNPGTTADLITAGLFCVLRDGALQGPFSTTRW